MSRPRILTFVTLMTLSLTPPWHDVRGAGPGPGREGGGLWPSVALPPPRAATTPQDGALIVSIEDYADPKMADVEGARQSGEDWQRWFTQARGLRSDRVRWLEDEQGTRNAILRELAELSAEVGSRGTLWVVFIGHGAPARDRSEGMLLGWAAQTGDEDEFYGQGVRHSEMVRAAKSGGPTSVVMLLDACFSGRSTTGESLVAGLQAGVMLDAPRAETGVLMLTAARSDQFAGRLPGAVRPAFSYLVLGALRGWADDKERGYGDGSGKVTAGEVVDYVRSALRTTALGRKQTPEVVGDAALVLATIKKGELERGPDLAEIQRRLKADDVVTPERTEPERKVDVERVEASGERVDLGLDVRDLDESASFDGPGVPMDIPVEDAVNAVDDQIDFKVLRLGRTSGLASIRVEFESVEGLQAAISVHIANEQLTVVKRALVQRSQSVYILEWEADARTTYYFRISATKGRAKYLVSFTVE